MKYARSLAIIASIIFVFLSGLATTAEAQNGNRKRVVRPIIVRQIVYRDPFWYGRWYDPWLDPWYSRHYYDPRVMFEREKYSRERKVSEERREYEKERQKSLRDGFITAKEQKEIDEEYREYRKAVDSLNKFNRRYSGYRN